jgi:hypothetical protein
MSTEAAGPPWGLIPRSPHNPLPNPAPELHRAVGPLLARFKGHALGQACVFLPTSGALAG